MSQYRIRIEDVANNRVAMLIPGGAGERDLIDTFTTSILSKGVGILRTERQVEAAIRSGIADALYSLKAEVLP